MYTRFGLRVGDLQVWYSQRELESRVWEVLEELGRLLASGKPAGKVGELEYKTTKTIAGMGVVVE